MLLYQTRMKKRYVIEIEERIEIEIIFISWKNKKWYGAPPQSHSGDIASGRDIIGFLKHDDSNVDSSINCVFLNGILIHKAARIKEVAICLSLTKFHSAH